MDHKPALLLVDADVRSAMLCKQVADKLDCGLAIAIDSPSALAAIDEHEVGVVLIGTGTVSGYLDLTREIKKRSTRIEIVISHSAPTISSAVEAIKAGATDYLQNPANAEMLEQTIIEALQNYRGFKSSVLPLDQVVKHAILHAVVQAEGNRIEAARLLGIGKTTLYRKLREYGEQIEPPRSRQSKMGK